MKKKFTLIAIGTAFKLIYLPIICFGQLFTTNGAVITSTAQITVKGDVLSQAGATIYNNGTIDMTGNFVNNAGNNCFANSSGTVVMNGTNQSIGGTDETMFNNLSLQGAGDKTLLRNTTVGGGYVNPAGVLALNDRFLDLNANQLTVVNGAATAITHTTGFIQSESLPSAGYSYLKWNIGNAPAGSAYSFPLGNISTNSYIPFDFTVSVPGNSSSGYISVATYPTDPLQFPNNRPLPLGVNALLNTSGAENADKTVDRFWMIHAGDYTIEPVATIKFTYRTDDCLMGNNNINEANLQAQRLIGSTWQYPMVGWDTPANNTVTVSNATQYDTIWALADNSAPLPVSLLSFDAKLQKNESVLCSWVTAAQINNDHFEVQRSKNGIDFESIGEVAGAGNSTSQLDYMFPDEAPYSGLSYYRLKQVDYDSRSTYSDTKAVMIGMKGIKYVAYPNPATSNLNLMFSDKIAFEGTIRIADVVGNIVQEKNIVVGENQLVQLDLTSLAPGNYLLQILSDGQFEQQKIAVVR